VFLTRASRSRLAGPLAFAIVWHRRFYTRSKHFANSFRIFSAQKLFRVNEQFESRRKRDGADVPLIEVEVVDTAGQRNGVLRSGAVEPNGAA
jgi:hypothetical protein